MTANTTNPTAGTPLNARTLTNWEHAFEQHSIPQVKALHRQLQNDLSVNREKLRALVGESYRDLLRTAEEIIDMNRSAQQVETKLAEASRNCNWRLLEKKARNMRVFQERAEERDREKFMFAAQLAVLQGCPAELLKLLHRNGSCILAARVFVMMRLVLKSVQGKGAVSPLVTSLAEQHISLRVLILRHIDQQLRAANISASMLIESMCALTLVRTCSPAELLRHFLNLRSNAISLALGPNALTSESILNALQLFNRTLRDIEAIFPKKVSEALYQLKLKPLFDNAELRVIPGINLDTNERWLPEDIRGFIPWVRHDELEGTRVNESIKIWATKELEALNNSLKQALSKIDDIEALVELRARILELWRMNKSQLLQVVIGSDPPRRRLRDLLNERLVEILDRRTEALGRVGEKIEVIAKELDETNKDSTSLWAETIVNMPISGGAALFRNTVKAVIRGDDRPVQMVMQVYNTWSNSIIKSFQVIENIRDVEKQDDLDLDDEDLFGLGTTEEWDNAEDRGLLQRKLRESIDRQFKDFQDEVERLVKACEEEVEKDSKSATTRSIFLLRVLRQIRLSSPCPPTLPSIPLGWFAKSLVLRLQSIISTGTSVRAISLLQRHLRKRKWNRNAPAMVLWEGSPLMPVQPSPVIFKFLLQLVTHMAEFGSTDVWTPATVECLVGKVKDLVWEMVLKQLEGRLVRDNKEMGTAAVMDKDKNGKPVEDSGEKPASEGNQVEQEDEKTEPSNDVSTEAHTTAEAKQDTNSKSTPPSQIITPSWATQLIFDLAYLHNALSRPTTSPLEPPAILQNLDSVDYDELNRRAKEYWKRTALLYSLLSAK